MTSNANPLKMHGELRTSAIRQKVRETIKAIELEIDRNDCIYPFNSGRLSQAEFCRRAEINQATLLRPKHRDTTKVDIDTWLESVASKLIKGKTPVRKAVTKRADDWKAKFDAVATNYHIYKLEAIAKDQKILDLQTLISNLRTEISDLQSQLNTNKVTHIHRNSNK